MISTSGTRQIKDKIQAIMLQTIVMITHDDEIAQVADRILVIEDGQVVDFR